MSGISAGDGMVNLRLLISGQVQGVGYRTWLVTEARRLGVAGWVRNLVDGRVEALLHGEAAKLERLIAACANGPTGAVVSRIDRFAPTNGSDDIIEGFEQR